MSEKNVARCSFCGKREDLVGRLIAGPSAFICDECVQLCYQLLMDDPDFDVEDDYESQVNKDNDMVFLKPVEIKKKLDEYVIGQDSAKIALAVAVYNHYKRINDKNSVSKTATKKKKKDNKEDDNKPKMPFEETELSKSNVLLIGPTGVGKTYLAQTLAKVLNVPFAIADATSLTEAGYVGEDVENILLRLIQAADDDVARAEKGIIFIDEIDKISRKSDNPSITRDVSGEGVQQALLKILEGTVANVPPTGGRKHPHQDFIRIDTTNILFICSGAFEGLPQMIEKRLGKSTIGFSGKIIEQDSLDVNRLLPQVEPQDLLKFGIIPEFIGRIPTVVTLQSLDKNALKNILTAPKNALTKQYQKLLAYDGVELVFTDDAIDAIADTALERKTGARGLRAIVERAMQDVMFNVPSVENVIRSTITKHTILNQKPPVLTFSSKEEKREELA